MNKFEYLENNFSSELLEEIKQFNEWILEQKNRFDPFLKEKYLSKHLIETLFDILNDSYGFINFVKENYDYEEEINKIIQNMVNQLDYFYHKMNRYQNFICSEDGFNAISEYGQLDDIDFYYNMAIINKNIDYLLSSLECSSDFILKQVDIIYRYDGEQNRKKRYQTYFSLLTNIFQRKPELFHKNKNNLYRICQGDDIMIKEFKNLTKKILMN
jgi:hypothetical protein